MFKSGSHTSKSQPNQPYIHSTNPGSENLQLTTLKSGWLKCGGENVVGEAEQTMRAVISGKTQTRVRVT